MKRMSHRDHSRNDSVLGNLVNNPTRDRQLGNLQLDSKGKMIWWLITVVGSVKVFDNSDILSYVTWKVFCFFVFFFQLKMYPYIGKFPWLEIQQIWKGPLWTISLIFLHSSHAAVYSRDKDVTGSCVYSQRHCAHRQIHLPFFLLFWHKRQHVIHTLPYLFLSTDTLDYPVSKMMPPIRMSSACLHLLKRQRV